MADRIVFVPRAIYLTNDAADPQHIANILAGYTQIFIQFPSISGTPSSPTLNNLATILQVIETLNTPVWCSVNWPDGNLGYITATDIRSAYLATLQAEVDAIYSRFSSINRTDLVRGFHFGGLNYSRRFVGSDGTITSVDRAFSNQLIEKSHLLGLRVAVDCEHPTELLSLVTPASPRAVQNLQGLPLVPTLLGSDSNLADVILARNPMWSQQLDNGTTPIAAMRPTGSRFGEIFGLAKSPWVANNLFVWPYQEFSLLTSPSDLSGGVHFASRTQAMMQGCSAFFEACGFQSYGVGVLEQGGSRKVLFIEEISPANTGYTANTTGTYSTVTSINGTWTVTFTNNGSQVVQTFSEDLILQ